MFFATVSIRFGADDIPRERIADPLGRVIRVYAHGRRIVDDDGNAGARFEIGEVSRNPLRKGHGR